MRNKDMADNDFEKFENTISHETENLEGYTDV